MAYEIGVNVPPVVLYRRPDAKAPEPSEVSISFSWGGAVPWGDLCNIKAADGNIKPPALAGMISRLVAASSGVMALVAWLGNTDRDNDGNAILTYAGEDDPGQLFYVDFANSMDYDGHWSADTANHQSFKRLPLPLLLAACAVRDRVRETAQRIVDLAEPVMIDIVRRVPEDFLAEAARDKLVAWLLWRKKQLIAAWSEWYAGN